MAQGRKKAERLTLILTWKAGQSGTKIACGVDEIITGWSAATILTRCNYAGHCPK